MPPATRVGDLSTHGGAVTGPGVATVLIGGQPAAVAGDLHICALPPLGHQPTVSAFPAGSATVLIAGRPALRTADPCPCGAMAAIGAPTVLIN
ncbi:MAG: PAAR domain-containing protein [bacterium]